MCPLWDNLSDVKVGCDRKRTVRNVPQVPSCTDRIIIMQDGQESVRLCRMAGTPAKTAAVKSIDWTVLGRSGTYSELI